MTGPLKKNEQTACPSCGMPMKFVADPPSLLGAHYYYDCTGCGRRLHFWDCNGNKTPRNEEAPEHKESLEARVSLFYWGGREIIDGTELGGASANFSEIARHAKALYTALTHMLERPSYFSKAVATATNVYWLIEQLPVLSIAAEKAAQKFAPRKRSAGRRQGVEKRAVLSTLPMIERDIGALTNAKLHKAATGEYSFDGPNCQRAWELLQSVDPNASAHTVRDAFDEYISKRP